MLLVVAVAALVIAATIVWMGRREERLARTAVLALASTGASFVAAVALISTGWNDIDGFVDCNHYCHGWQFLGGFLFLTPLLVGLLLTLVLLVIALNHLSALARRQDRRADRARDC